jgi:hypothetical protein
MAEKKQMIEIRCATCGSTDVRRDALASWNFEEQEWQLSGVLDEGYCEDCGMARGLKEVDVTSDYIKDTLLATCREFIQEERVHSNTPIYHSRMLQEELPGLLERICTIVGYFEDDKDDKE